MALAISPNSVENHRNKRIAVFLESIYGVLLSIKLIQIVSIAVLGQMLPECR